MDEEVDSVLWERASKFYFQKALQARAEVSAIEINLDEIDQVMEEVLEQSDRGAAILIFSYVETLMHRVCLLHLNGAIKGGAKTLFENNGPLGTAHSRLSMLAALSWVGQETYEGLDLLRRVRNHFAHHVEAKSFADRKVSGWVSSLPQLEKRFETVPGLDGVFHRSNGMSLRHLFLARSTLLVWNLTIESALDRKSVV